MDREENRMEFMDTQTMYRTDAFLVRSIGSSVSRQEFISGDSGIRLPDKVHEKACQIRVSTKRTIEAAGSHTGRTVVLNFASWTNPGGGVVSGSDAQEESLCRISTLFPCISDQRMMEAFYLPHRATEDRNGRILHNSDCIYTPDVMFFKSDSRTPRLLPRNRWLAIDVITCSAPNLRAADGRRIWIGDKDLLEIHTDRIGRILDIASVNRADNVVLGAFGCGAFLNDPEIVAMASLKALKTRMFRFRNIEFAIAGSDRDQTNYNAFRTILSTVT